MGVLSKGKSFQDRYACHLSLSVVALGAIGFVLEVFNMLEYIKGLAHTKLYHINEKMELKNNF